MSEVPPKLRCEIIRIVHANREWSGRLSGHRVIMRVGADADGRAVIYWRIMVQADWLIGASPDVFTALLRMEAAAERREVEVRIQRREKKIRKEARQRKRAKKTGGD